MNIKRAVLAAKTIVTNPGSFIRTLEGSVRWFQQSELLRLANNLKTDKGFYGHGYVRIYESLLGDKRDSITDFCEIGLLRLQYQSDGDKTYVDTPSLSMWSKYLPQAEIVGFDIQKFSEPKEKNCTFIQGDQANREDLQKLIDHKPEYDVILEDALHASRHQQITLSYLFKALKPGGYFIIEDLQTTAEGTDESGVPRTQKLLHELQYTGRWNSPLATPEEKAYIENNVDSVQFFDSLQEHLGAKGNTDAVAVIKKK